MKVSNQRRGLLEEMTPLLEENKSLKTSMNDLQVYHYREDLEVKVLALEKEHQ